MRIIKSLSFLICVVILFILFIVNSCSESTNPNDKKFVLPEKNLSFYEHIEPLFSVRCGLESSCHAIDNPSIPLSYNELVNRDGLVYHQLSKYPVQLVDLEVDPINPQNSALFLILTVGFPDNQDIMPPFSRERLTTNQLNGIKQWIREGAPN